MVRFPGGVKIFSSPKRLDRLWGMLFELVKGFISSGIKRPVGEAYHSPSCRAEVNEWLYTSTAHAFMEWLILHRESV